MRIVSLNLRYAHSADMNTQGIREPRIADFVKAFRPDSFGVQECEKFWYDRLTATIGALGYVPAQPEAYSEKGSYAFKNFIWYDPNKSELVESGRMWLSETPDVPSRGFGSRFYISAGYAVLKDKYTGECAAHVNTHLNVDSQDIRISEVEVLKTIISELEGKGYPVFVTGDFNSGPLSPIYAEMTKNLADSRYVASVSTDLKTYTGYKEENVDIPKEKYLMGDFCFQSKEGVRTDKFDVVDKWGGGYLSDHNALIIDVTLSKEVEA